MNRRPDSGSFGPSASLEDVRGAWRGDAGDSQ